MTEPDAFRLGVELATTLDRAGIPNALGGAISLAAWGVPRATVDVDINVFVTDDQLGAVFDVLDRDMGLDVDRAVARHRHERDGMMVFRTPGGMRIDIFTPSIEFSWEAARTSSRQIILGRDVAVLSAEALAVFTLLFFRLKDRADLERLIAVRGPDLDQEYVRHWIADMMGEDDERTRAWDDLVGRFGSPPDEA